MTNDRKKIIVVDDNLESLTAIKNTLKEKYEVFPIAAAIKMFDLLEHLQPDLILLDVEMPGMNGYEAAQKLKSNDKFRDIPIIFLTSMDDAQSEMEGLSIGAVDYIRKPFVAPLLLKRLETHLSLLDHQLEAQNASRAKGDFLSRMSHEIRSPLNAIIGMINIAAGANDIQKIKYCLEKADSASRHLMGIINDILDMSKIEANRLELSNSEFNFEKMLTGIINVMSVRAGEKHQDIVVNVNENIPPFIISDELRLSQVITNLLTNAVKFTPENGKITLSAEKLDDSGDEITIRIEVADSGIGISPEQQTQLFTPYQQANSAISKDFGGTGLGLAISKRIVEFMQGAIWIESELNKGSKFIFTIKAKKGANNAGEVSPNGSPAGSKGTGLNFKGYTILAAEDVEINREILSALLEETGISIDFAENGKAAVSLFTENPDKYNLILMDVHMPEMDGYEATRAIRAFEMTQAKDIHIIAMTADVFREDIEKCLSAGMNDHIGKPVSPDDLYEKLKKYLPC
ncbi:MAG: response regulator [Treponema sp.]|jgi:signal transduction histidine kinase|nr:response regulator [Treponema sp.]